MIAAKLALIRSQVTNLRTPRRDVLLREARARMEQYGLAISTTIEGITTKEIAYSAYDKTARAIVQKVDHVYSAKAVITWSDADDGETLSVPWTGTGTGTPPEPKEARENAEQSYLLRQFTLTRKARRK